jgi:hypothetical protein
MFAILNKYRLKQVAPQAPFDWYYKGRIIKHRSKV